MRMPDYLTACEVIALALWVEIAIRVMPFSRLLERTPRPSSPTADRDTIASEYRRLVRFVVVAYDVLPFPATCLRQSLLLNELLERRGVPSRVLFGVAKSGSALAAHAWVDCVGITPDATATRFGELLPRRN
jgi:hypothetical protein